MAEPEAVRPIALCNRSRLLPVQTEIHYRLVWTLPLAAIPVLIYALRLFWRW